MSDIFLSYASEDRERAGQIAAALSDHGWSVWWDRQIPFGKSFDKVIEENLAKAKCVVVLWTRHSVESRWVRAEASEGVGRDLLLPVVLERDLKLPLEFKMVQAANLADWRPGQPHEEFKRLLKNVDSLLSAAPANDAKALAENGASTHRDSNGDDNSSPAIVSLRDTKSKRTLYLVGLLVLRRKRRIGRVVELAFAVGIGDQRGVRPERPVQVDALTEARHQIPAIVRVLRR